MKKLIVGLGNPGKEYESTRHNCGFIIVDQLVQDLNRSWKSDAKLKSLVIETPDVIYLKPQTYMNLVGEAVQKAVSYYKIDLNKLCVIHDDADIPPQYYKFQFGKEAAGHHGVEDIIDKLSDKSFWRIRVGISRPENSEYELEDWVLKRLTDEEHDELIQLSPKIEKELDKL